MGLKPTFLAVQATALSFQKGRGMRETHIQCFTGMGICLSMAG